MDSGDHDMNESAFLHRFIGISVALVIALASGLASSAEETKQPLPPPPLAYTKADQPSWLPRVLNLLVKKKGWILKDHRLFRQGGKPTFLALIWNTRRISGHGHMELYKVRVISKRNVRLNFVRGYTQTSLSIEEPSGTILAATACLSSRSAMRPMGRLTMDMESVFTGSSATPST